MKKTTQKFIAVLLVVLLGSFALVDQVRAATITFVANAQGAGSTTPGINTTGANLLVVVDAYFSASCVNPTVSDTIGGVASGNTWVGFTPSNSGGNCLTIFYAKNANVGASHVFTTTGGGSITVEAFAGADPTAPFDVSSSASTGSSNANPGNITPSVNGEVVIIGSQAGGTGGGLSSPGYTITNTFFGVSGVSYGVGQGYQIQTTATAQNPTMTASSGAFNNVYIASFKPSATVVTTPHVSYMFSGVNFNFGSVNFTFQ